MCVGGGVWEERFCSLQCPVTYALFGDVCDGGRGVYGG